METEKLKKYKIIKINCYTGDKIGRLSTYFESE